MDPMEWSEWVVFGRFALLRFWTAPNEDANDMSRDLCGYENLVPHVFEYTAKFGDALTTLWHGCHQPP